MTDQQDIIISLLKEISKYIGNAGGGSGGGLTSEGTPGNIPIINEDGKTLQDGLVSASDIQGAIQLIGSWDEDTLNAVLNAS